MEKAQQQKAILMLEDGQTYEGFAIGLIGTATGEICFNTGMTGYQEIFTDPSYFGQILITTNVHLGNYGALDTETESENIKIAGLICRNFSEGYSRIPAEESLQEYFERNGLTGISGVDTRELVRHIRTKGAMNAIISSEIFDLDQLRERLAQAPSMAGLELASAVSVKEPYTIGDDSALLRIAVLDFGIKKNILRSLAKRGCFIKVFPAKTTFQEMQAWDADGYFLSNGPGDPASMDYAVETAREILNHDKPLFGICLGHQLLARAMGVKTYKMHHGHRGINHPVKNLISGHCEITSQNHGFGVSPEAIEANLDKIEITHLNLNDQTIEGIRIKGKKAFSVQYHPEASPGPHDSSYLFDEFVHLMQN